MLRDPRSVKHQQRTQRITATFATAILWQGVAMAVCAGPQPADNGLSMADGDSSTANAAAPNGGIAAMSRTVRLLLLLPAVAGAITVGVLAQGTDPGPATAAEPIVWVDLGKTYEWGDKKGS
jgi:hypothetical protein